MPDNGFCDIYYYLKSDLASQSILEGNFQTLVRMGKPPEPVEQAGKSRAIAF